MNLFFNLCGEYTEGSSVEGGNGGAVRINKFATQSHPYIMTTFRSVHVCFALIVVKIRSTLRYFRPSDPPI
jgi:hypothetical protein